MNVGSFPNVTGYDTGMYTWFSVNSNWQIPAIPYSTDTCKMRRQNIKNKQTKNIRYLTKLNNLNPKLLSHNPKSELDSTKCHPVIFPHFTRQFFKGSIHFTSSFSNIIHKEARKSNSTLLANKVPLLPSCCNTKQACLVKESVSHHGIGLLQANS